MNIEYIKQKYQNFIEKEKEYFTFSEETLNNFYEKLTNEFKKFDYIYYKSMAKTFFDIYCDYDDDLYSLEKFFDELFSESEIEFSNEEFKYFPMYGFEKEDNLINTYIPTNIIKREAYSNIKVDCISLVSYRKIRVPKDSFIILSKINSQDYASFVSRKDKIAKYFSYNSDKNHILIPEDNVLPHGDLYSYCDEKYKYFEITNTPKKNYKLHSRLSNSLDLLNLRFSESKKQTKFEQTKISKNHGDIFGYWLSPDNEIIPVTNFQGHDDLAIRVLNNIGKNKNISNQENMMNNGWIHITYIDESNSRRLNDLKSFDPKMMICLAKNMVSKDNLKNLKKIIMKEKPTYGVILEFHDSKNQLNNDFYEFEDYKKSLNFIQSEIIKIKNEGGLKI